MIGLQHSGACTAAIYAVYWKQPGCFVVKLSMLTACDTNQSVQVCNSLGDVTQHRMLRDLGAGGGGSFGI